MNVKRIVSGLEIGLVSRKDWLRMNYPEKLKCSKPFIPCLKERTMRGDIFVKVNTPESVQDVEDTFVSRLGKLGCENLTPGQLWEL